MTVRRKYWSDKVTKGSDALDLEEGVFIRNDPDFYINRAGKNLKPEGKNS